MRFVLTCSVLVTPWLSASAHHSPNVHFDRNDVVEIEGILTEVGWHNPHVQLTVVTRGDDGNEVE